MNHSLGKITVVLCRAVVACLAVIIVSGGVQTCSAPSGTELLQFEGGEAL